MEHYPKEGHPPPHLQLAMVQTELDYKHLLLSEYQYFKYYNYYKATNDKLLVSCPSGTAESMQAFIIITENIIIVLYNIKIR